MRTALYPTTFPENGQRPAIALGVDPIGSNRTRQCGTRYDHKPIFGRLTRRKISKCWLSVFSRVFQWTSSTLPHRFCSKMTQFLPNSRFRKVNQVQESQPTYQNNPGLNILQCPIQMRIFHLNESFLLASFLPPNKKRCNSERTGAK